MFPDELDAALEECPVVYLPYGLCEPHRPQNALGNDAQRPHGAACLAAREHGGIVAPPEYWHCHGYGIYSAWGYPIIGEQRPWLTCVPPWMFMKNICYHVRAVDALGFQAAILFSGHAGPHSADVEWLVEVLQEHVAVRLGLLIGVGTDRDRFGDGLGEGGHAGRGETSLLWAVAPDCVDLSRVPGARDPGPHFAMGQYADKSDRRVGEQMTADIVEGLGAMAKELLAHYATLKPQRKPLTYGEVEEIWESEIWSRRADWRSMQDLHDGQEAPAPDSQWHHNWRVPDFG